MERSDQKSLSGEEICAILKASAESGVLVLKYRGLEAHFNGTVDLHGPSAAVLELRNRIRTEAYRPNPESGQPSTPATEIAAKQKQVEATAKVQDEILIREEQLLNLPIENPVLFERLMLKGELDRDESDAADDDDDSGT